jgi:uncharacterized membrane protein YhaH (DUF805 family)
MTFSDAVRDAFSKYVTFRGRSSRSAYWWFYLFTVLVVIAAAVLDVIFGTAIISPIVTLAIFLPSIAVLVRRLHDAGHSAWWLLIGFLPIIGGILLLVFTLQRSEPPNDWGDAPDTDAPLAVT